MLVEAITYRFRGHSMADPEEYRSKEQVAEWRKRDPIESFGERLLAEGVLDEDERGRLDEDAIARIDAAVAFADASAEPAPESLYDNVYVLGGQVHGWWSVDTTHPEAGPPTHPEDSDSTGAVPQQMTAALEAAEEA
jgi:TPP-dependent pyruvate/acetoin dehydrogenase alpha subunit